MKLDRQWHGWRHIERGALLTTCVVCTFVAAQPLRERLFAWQSQRALQAKWQQSLAKSNSHQKTDNTAKASSPSDETQRVNWQEADAASSIQKGNGEEELPILWPVTRLLCPRIDLDAIVVQGTDDEQLKLGPGHEANTSFPGGSNCVIAAHRNAYGWWFYRLDNLKRGDELVVQVPGRKYTYRVATSRLVSMSDTSILQERANVTPRLTLYTCTLPKTESRFVVVANLQCSQAT